MHFPMIVIAYEAARVAEKPPAPPPPPKKLSPPVTPDTTV
jgi:hypothetical protein